MKSFLFLCITIFFISCNINKKPENTAFKIPLIINQKDSTATYFEADSITTPYAFVIGRFKLRDTVKISNKLIYDEFEKTISTLYEEMDDTFSVDGLAILPDYNNTIHYGADSFNKLYYPVVISNQTNEKKALIGKDDYVFAIQEAVDKDGMWRPIETSTYGFSCDNGYWFTELSPNQFFVFLLPKYKGDFKTKLRLRFKNGNTIYVSKPFIGEININQFSLKRNKELFRWLSQNNYAKYHSAYYFYGANLPQEIEHLY